MIRMGDFTLEDYNDKPLLCPHHGCDGLVHPTWNANVGKCDKCNHLIPWGWNIYCKEGAKFQWQK